MVSQRTVPGPDGRLLVCHDTALPAAGEGPVVLWHHGSPQTGALLEPLLAAAGARGIRMVSYARPGYGGSTRRPDRDVASAAGDVAAVADALGIVRFAVMGASGGGPHALACAALLPDRTWGVACLAALAPRDAGFDWYAGMAAPGGLHAAEEGRASRERFAATDTFDPASFTAADWAALRGAWAALGADAGRAEAAGAEGLVDDDVAFVRPWGFAAADVRAPVLLVQGDEDRVVPPSHGAWLHGVLPDAVLWRRTGDGHVSVLDAVPAAMDWLLARAPGSTRT